MLSVEDDNFFSNYFLAVDYYLSLEGFWKRLGLIMLF